MDEHSIQAQHSNNMVAIASVFGLFIFIGIFIIMFRTEPVAKDPLEKGNATSGKSAAVVKGDTTTGDQKKEIPSQDSAPQNSQDAESRELVSFEDIKNDTQEPPVTKGPAAPDTAGITPGTTLRDNYILYSESALEQTLEDQGSALLFFHANWCPTCRVADKSIMDEGSKLPKNLTVLKIDYDSEKDLVRKYDVSVSHTFVLIDKNEKEIKKWTGGNVDSIIENL